MVIEYLKSGAQKIKKALTKTRDLLGSRIRSLFSSKIDESTLEQLEQILYEADLGVQTSADLTSKIRQKLQKNPEIPSSELLQYLEQEIFTLLTSLPASPSSSTQTPFVTLIVGVNGNGKTTTTAKLAKKAQQDGKKVLIGAADTFRAAATEQLEKWAHLLNIEIVKGFSKSDPAAVAFDCLSASKARGYDYVLIDTAGRLHTKTPLMQELDKIRRSCQKVIPDAPHEILLVLDATTGQNGVDQAKTFAKFVPLTGLILTKLDGTAKGGIIVSIQQQLRIPVKYIGTGESLDDLEPFNAEVFSKSLFE